MTPDWACLNLLILFLDLGIYRPQIHPLADITKFTKNTSEYTDNYRAVLAYDSNINVLGNSYAMRNVRHFYQTNIVYYVLFSTVIYT